MLMGITGQELFRQIKQKVKITPRIQVLARYDQYTPDKDFSDDIRREYSAGVNYFIKGQALKLMLNYVFCQNDLFEDSHRVILGTQLML